MPKYKRQHYLPVVYLKNFSTEANATRKSSIWRFDGISARKVSVESQCASDYFYSKDRPAEAEKLFHGVEKLYGRCVIKIKSGHAPDIEEYFGLILAVFDFHLRGAAYANLTNEEGVFAYRLRLEGFKRALLMGKRDEISDDEVSDHLKKYWRVRVLSPRESLFITSDHPSAWIALERSTPSLNLAVLPLTPTHVAIAFDKRLAEVAQDYANLQDLARLNRIQVVQALKSVYASEDFSGDQREVIQELFTGKRPSKGSIDKSKWQAGLLRLPADSHFSFLQVKNRRV